jgi:hypothetical protein
VIAVGAYRCAGVGFVSFISASSVQSDDDNSKVSSAPKKKKSKKTKWRGGSARAAEARQSASVRKNESESERDVGDKD